MTFKTPIRARNGLLQATNFHLAAARRMPADHASRMAMARAYATIHRLSNGGARMLHRQRMVTTYIADWAIRELANPCIRAIFIAEHK